MSDTPYVGSGPTNIGLTGGHHRVACLFATREAAERAADDLASGGIDRSAIQIVNQADSTATDGSRAGEIRETEGGGLWESIKRMFSGDEADSYYEGVNRGNVLLTAQASSEADAERIGTILERHDPIDITAEESAWRNEGWTGRPTPHGAIGDAATLGTPGTSPAMATGTAAPGIGGAKPAMPTAATRTPEMAGRSEAATARGAEEVIPLVREDVTIGKRSVAGGSVRVRTHVIETPVTENVQLRDERVQIERRPVSGAGRVTDDAFRERSIEMDETREEAVVSKTAHVTEEVVVRKDSSERNEQVHETVRRTEAEVEDTRNKPGTPR